MLRTPLLLICFARFVSSKNMEGFVVGGRPAEMKFFGHSAFIIVEMNQNAGFVCGGSILNQNIILSAAHCFEGFNGNSRVSIRVGNVDKMKGALRYASRVAVHSSYDPHTVDHDIALGYTKRPFVFGPHIQRVIIMKRPPHSDVGYVAGWGLMDEIRQTDSQLLLRAKQSLWTRDQCKKVLRRIPHGIICGGVRHSNEYAAEGDSGSALIINGPIQVGLVSFKRPDISRSLVVYTDVAYYYNWIVSTAKRLFCS